MLREFVGLAKKCDGFVDGDVNKELAGAMTDLDELRGW